MTKKQLDEKEAQEFLRARLSPGSKVWTDVVHVAKSGMSRQIKVIIQDQDGEPWNASAFAGRALGWPVDRDRMAVKVSGCGMDMGFHIVHSLSYALHGKSQGEGAKAEAPGTPGNGPRFDDREADAKNYRGGYSLQQVWL